MGKIEPHCLGKPTGPGRSGRNNRLFLEAVLWIVRTVSPWRDLPTVFGNWSTTFRRFRDWRKADVFKRLRELANQRRRFGYRRLHILLRREGVMINRKKTQRLYKEEGLEVRRRRSRARAVGTRAPTPVLAFSNQRWSLDFVHDQIVTGRRFRVLNVVDDVTRECLAAVPDISISGCRVVRELTELIALHGKPGMIVSNNGTELTSNAVLAGCGAGNAQTLPDLLEQISEDETIQR